ncbi:MAG: MFS transporter [Hydrogenophilaceae bacterium]|jgi:predicted MFS family arabinose efflux permease|nr:MFS transporter [Hydrogenophilaceae bacterium]
MTTTAPSARPTAYRWFALFILFVVALFNYVDRSILAILQVPVKAELNLSDTQLGALTGLAFALLYTTLALPIARLADRTVRTRLLSAALTIWSGMTALSGLATNFATLVVCRMGVALGEAGCVPATHSLISDYFQRHQRATALALWGLSMPLGVMLGLAFGGWLAENVGWRQAFIGIGLFGVAFAPIVWLALREPPRGRYDPPPQQQAQAQSFMAQVQVLWRLKAFRYAALAGAMIALVQHSVTNWNAPFYDRVHRVPLAEASYYLAVIMGLGGGLGTFLGGVAADRLGKRDVRWYLGAPALACLLMAPVGLVQYFADSVQISFAAAFLANLLVHVYLAPIVATSQTLVPANMRAFTSAMLVLTVNLLGMGIGPLGVGAASDLLVAAFGMETDSLRYAISLSLFFCLPAAWLFWAAARRLPTEMRGESAEGEPDFIPGAAPQRH